MLVQTKCGNCPAVLEEGSFDVRREIVKHVVRKRFERVVSAHRTDGFTLNLRLGLGLVTVETRFARTWVVVEVHPEKEGLRPTEETLVGTPPEFFR